MAEPGKKHMLAIEEQKDFSEFGKWLEENRSDCIPIMVAGKKGWKEFLVKLCVWNQICCW